MKRIIPYIIIVIFSGIIGRLIFTPKPKIIYKDKFKERVIDYQNITDSITNTISNQVADTQYTFIDSIRWKDSLRIKDSIITIPYSVVKFNYSDSLLFASVSTYYNNNSSKYDFKYTIKPSKYSFLIDYNSPDTLKVNFSHQHFFNKDSIIVLNTIDDYLKYEINKVKRPWYDSYWLGALSGIGITTGIILLTK